MLAHHAVILAHGMRRRGGQVMREFVDGGVGLRSEALRLGGLAEDGDRITSRQIRLPGQTATVDAVTWNHDPEATVLAQQVDAPQLWEGLAVTEFFEVCCSGPLRDHGAPRRRGGTAFTEVLAADRDALVDLLEALHNARDLAGRPVYERVVIVGHHWGGAVARQAVEACWERRQAAGAAEAGDEVADAIRDVESAECELRAHAGEESAWVNDPYGAAAKLRSRYRQAQSGLWRVMRDAGPGPHRWIVSDLVTLGYPRSAPAPAGRVLPVRLTNAWVSHADGAGPLAPLAGPGVEDIALEVPRLAVALPRVWPGNAYWVAGGHPMAREGSRLSIALLRRMVRRRPTLLLRAPAPLQPAQVQELAAAVLQAAAYPTARGAVLADVRLLVGTDGVCGHPFPVGAVPIPAAIALREVRAMLGPGGRVQVVLSSGLLPPLDPTG